MCAIIGALGEHLPPEEQFIKARDTMTHRGPDDAGVYYASKEGIALGHRRLSIIDLSSLGKQPFVSNDKRFILTYNGEIYNYVELKKELAAYYDFRTKTDTEVLLAAYIQWGEQCLQKLHGMFAFAIWDTKEKILFCARDRLGIKPFFYHYDGDTFVFASEIKALLASGIRPALNERIVFDYLYYGFYDYSEETFFDGVKTLPGGSFLKLQGKVLAIKKYWDLAYRRDDVEEISMENAEEKFKALLADSIKLHFRSDVPVGLGLSSGLDSNTLLYYSEEVTGHTMHTFSECLASNEYNECLLIDEYLNKTQKKLWHRKALDADELFAFADEENKIQDQPYGGIPTIANTKRYEEAKNFDAKVLLEGEGLDEILGGYRYYRDEYEKDVAHGTDGRGEKRGAQKMVSYGQDMTPAVERNVLNAGFVTTYTDAGLSFKAPFRSHLLNAQYRDIMYTKMPRVLRFKDHASMVYGREVRVPFLDHRFVEFCFFLPPHLKIQKQTQKVLLRKVMKEYIPDIVRGRDKKAFGAVQTEWMRTHYRREISSLLSSRSFKKRPYWNHAALAEKVGRFFEGEGGNSFFIWQCINLELWLRKFID